ncbi:hypothetical protein ANCCAN_23229 [Ancylostoma caninum]|uniref:Uncharacterized protein n=1 Tax=Ancylostoma caninum TaxID=29170 RepID=A0A368FJ52_ANCCA|nr:hypothetical protein ANCCAN_23229 [Ancylostoma caninum]
MTSTATLMWLATLLLAHLFRTVSSCTPITPLNIHDSPLALTSPPTTTTPPIPALFDYHDDNPQSRVADPISATRKHSNDDDVPLQRSATELKRDEVLPPAERAPRLLPSLFDLFRPLNLHSWTANSFSALSTEKDINSVRYSEHIVGCLYECVLIKYSKFIYNYDSFWTS